jgi:hypothetical protein
VRLPESEVSRLPVEKAECFEGLARVITKPLSVLKMHRIAAELRKEGGSLFFAALGE